MAPAGMTEAPRAPWRHLEICQVEDASTMWVREVPSQACSEELLQFLEMEKQMNHHFKNKRPQDQRHASLITMGNHVVVRYKDTWARGKVEKLPQARREKATVFLLDYGLTYKADIMAIIPLHKEEWTSVPCQAKKIALHAVVPVSLQYALINQELKLTLKRCNLWDASATDFVKLLASKKPQVEFTPMKHRQEGLLCGMLMISLPEEVLVPIIPEVSKSKVVQLAEDGRMAIEVAQLLADCEFAQLLNEGEDLDPLSPTVSGHSQSCSRSTGASASAAASAPSRGSGARVGGDREVVGGTRSSLSKELSLTVAGETNSSNHDLEINVAKQMEGAGVEGVEKNGTELESESSVSGVDTRGLYSRMDASLCTEVTSPLFKRLSSNHSTFAKAKALFSFFKSESECHSPALFTETSREISKMKDVKAAKDASVTSKVTNEPAAQNGNYNKCSPCLSIDGEEEDSRCEPDEADSGMQAAAWPSEQREGRVSGNSGLVRPRRPGRPSLPCWASMSLLGAVHDPQHTTHKQNSNSISDIHRAKRDCSKIDEKGKTASKLICADIKNLEKRKGISSPVKKKTGCENTEHLNTYTCTEEPQLASDACFMTGSHDSRPGLSTSALDQVYNSFLKKDCHPNRPKTVKTSRVFVAGESPILEEEVMDNQDIMSATLNSHIFHVLNQEGMKATRLQAFTWPTIMRGCSAVVVGEKACGKTLGYVVPLLSTILDTYQHISGRLPTGIGPLMVVICSSWRNVECVTEYVVGLLPADTTLKVMPAWGGCGREEEISIGKQLLGGCDILLTTAPCLLRCLSGASTLWGGGTEGATTTLTRCCHLVVDDADVVLKHFSPEVKQIITLWGEERKKCDRSDLALQVVLVSSQWTKLLSQLTHVLSSLLDFSTIIATPYEAAIATKVKNHIHLMSDETESLGFVMSLIGASYSQKKTIVFVKSDSVANTLGSMMKNIALYCLVVNSTDYKGKLEQLVDEWHAMQGVTMIVSEPAEKALLYHDVCDAHAIFNTHLGSAVNTFTHRYGFMVEHFVTDVGQKSFNCECYIVLPRCLLERTREAWRVLERLVNNNEEQVKMHLSTENEAVVKSTIALCPSLKAYGRCFDQVTCGCRHDVCLSDTARHVPKSGRVTIEVMHVLNASQYLVRLTAYQDQSGGQRTDLSDQHSILESALQHYYAHAAHREPLQYGAKGMLCALKDNDVWVRARVVSVNYSQATSLLNVFLMDEGKELTIETSFACLLPSHLAVIPQLIMEVFVCGIQPWDQDGEWTPQASDFVCEVFGKNKKGRCVGTVVLAMAHTLWLNPLVVFSKLGNTYVPRKSVHSKLVTERFGMNNPSHIENLEQLCSQAGVLPGDGDMSDQAWLETRSEALQKLTIDADSGNLSSDALTNGEIDMEETIHDNEECSNNVLQPGDDVNVLPTHHVRPHQPEGTAGKDHLPATSPEQAAHPVLSVSYEQLPLNTATRAQLTELVSPEKFYVIREDNLEELAELEGEIDTLHDYLECCEERSMCGAELPFQPSAGAACIAKFTDNKYHRGLVKARADDFHWTVFSVDHGETIKIPEWQVHACARGWLEYMPGQAVRCTLAHLTVPPPLCPAATQAMHSLTRTTHSWKVKALEVRGDEDGPLYVVELTADALDPPLEMWQELVRQGVAFMETEIVSDDGASELFNASDIDDQEIADFLLGISAVRQYKADQGKEEVPTKHNTTDVEIEQKQRTHCNSYSLRESDSASDFKQQNGCHISHNKGKESKHVNTLDEIKSTISNVESVDSVPAMNHKHTEKQHSDLTLRSEEQDKGQETEVQKCGILEGRRKDVNRTVVSASHIFNMQRLGMPPLSAVEGVTRRLRPETSWSQKEKNVHISIHLVGVEQYKCRVSTAHFIFMSVLGDKFYALDEVLCHEVITDACVVNVLGISLSITLEKAVKGKWKTLFKNKIPRPWLRGEYQDLSSDGDSSDTADYDQDGWKEARRKSAGLPRGGLPAGISDTDADDDSENSDGGKLGYN